MDAHEAQYYLSGERVQRFLRPGDGRFSTSLTQLQVTPELYIPSTEFQKNPNILSYFLEKFEQGEIKSAFGIEDSNAEIVMSPATTNTLVIPTLRGLPLSYSPHCLIGLHLEDPDFSLSYQSQMKTFAYNAYQAIYHHQSFSYCPSLEDFLEKYKKFSPRESWGVHY